MQPVRPHDATQSGETATSDDAPQPPSFATFSNDPSRSRGILAKACDACKKNKQKCEVEKPCVRCVGRNEICVYEGVAYPPPQNTSAQDVSYTQGPSKRRVITKDACDWCRDHKIKCSRGPNGEACSRCLQLGQVCVLTNKDRRRPLHGTLTSDVSHAEPEWRRSSPPTRSTSVQLEDFDHPQLLYRSGQPGMGNPPPNQLLPPTTSRSHTPSVLPPHLSNSPFAQPLDRYGTPPMRRTWSGPTDNRSEHRSSLPVVASLPYNNLPLSSTVFPPSRNSPAPSGSYFPPGPSQSRTTDAPWTTDLPPERMHSPPMRHLPPLSHGESSHHGHRPSSRGPSVLQPSRDYTVHHPPPPPILPPWPSRTPMDRASATSSLFGEYLPDWHRGLPPPKSSDDTQ